MGRASALLFGAEGAKVVLADVNAEAGEAVAAECADAGGDAVFAWTDVTREEDVQAAVGLAVSRFGKLDVMFNNAGAGGPVGVEDVTVEAWDAAHALLLRSVFLGMKHSIPELRRAGGGSIITTSSSAALRPMTGAEAYSAFKAGIVGLTLAVAQTVGPDGIRVNAIAPGWTATPLLFDHLPGGAETGERMMQFTQPIKRVGRPEDIARAALFLASDDAAFVSGVVLPVDGGFVAQLIQHPDAEAELARAAADTPAWMAR
jgi:NAD(P)-dependent dehydrogenase (short-subunit alcohol dehydrogenase family)